MMAARTFRSRWYVACGGRPGQGRPSWRSLSTSDGRHNNNDKNDEEEEASSRVKEGVEEGGVHSGGEWSGEEEGSRPRYVFNPKSIFVRSLPRSYDALMVADLCTPFGPVADVKVYYFKNSRESKGSATVEFLDEEAAEKARSNLDGLVLEGAKDALDVDTGKTRA
ncbi:RRM domain-containing protein [Chloropicon primus]|uniref:RRM domain-containing protein n=1 Tax=Chloropicon primus TaxID=1764295 RepID=A0A5B8MT01_9CHLO|nr:hypothetical protein A3770_08p52730 [Chloropicon primus]UPR01979.1 RRM domain-containing protein [Chloropicon primus]|eukprot:QDZ22755.1 hypothetical protein A3770_08p52730 [Chloropicon primus]